METEKRPGSLLGSLRTAVKKVRFLLSFSATRWILSSIAGRNNRAGAREAAPPRRLSFGSRRPSLLDAEDSRLVSPEGPDAAYSRTASLGAGSVSRTSSAASSELTWRSPSSVGTSSLPGDDEDIDRRAELFIANFYKHIQMERQVSLQLRYCRAGQLGEDASQCKVIDRSMHNLGVERSVYGLKPEERWTMVGQAVISP